MARAKFQRTLAPLGGRLLVCIGLALLISCGGGREKEAVREGALEPRQGGTLVVGVAGEPDSFNPYLTQNKVALEIANRVLPRLWRERPYDGSDRPLLEPELAAEGWELSEDGLALRVPLEAGWAWEDGTPVTCEDLRFTFEIQKHPTLGRRVADVKELLAGVECPEPLLAVYSFERPSPRPLEDVNDIHVLPRSLDAIPRESWSETDWSEALPAAGAFRIASRTQGQEVVLEKNEAYVGAPERPYVERIVLRPIADSRTAITQLLAGELDMVSSLDPGAARMLGASEDVRIERRPAWRYVYAGWNTVDPEAYARYRKEREAECARGEDERCPDRSEHMVRLALEHPHPLLGDARVRRALTLGIDRRQIIDVLLGGEGEVPPSPILAPLPEHDPALEPWDYDPERAHELLREAGFEDSDGDNVLDKEGRPFEISLWVGAGNTLRNDAAVFIKQNLAMLGVEVEIVPVEGLFPRLATRTMDGWIARWHIPARVDMRLYLHAEGSASGGGNFGSWHNARADELASAAVAELDPAARADLFHEWEAIFQQEQPYTILFRDRELVGVRSRVHGTESLTALDTLHGVEDWWIQER